MSDFSPKIWYPVQLGRLGALLVCERRMIRGRILSEDVARSQRTYDWFCHPVGIGLTPPRIEFEVRDCCWQWQLDPVESFGLNIHTARAALKEAWRLFDPKRTSFDPISLSAKYSARINSTPIRNLTVFMNWDRWKREGKSLEERAAELAVAGIQITPKALRRLGEERGVG